MERRIVHEDSALDHPPYEPDLGPCEFYLFPKINFALYGKMFQAVEDVKENSQDPL